MAPSAWAFGPDSQNDLIAATAARAGLPIGKAVIGTFADGEQQVRIAASLWGEAVVLIASTGPPAASNLMTLACLADAARRSGAHPIVAVVPYLGYARGDHQAEPGTPIPGRLVADLLQAAGITHLVTVDLHSPAIVGFFTIPVLETTAVDALAEALGDVSPARHVVVAPDAGAIKRVSRVAMRLGLPMAFAAKHRPTPETPKVLSLWGDVAGREAIIVDDMVSTGSTVAAVARSLREHGVTAIDLVATHAVMVAEAEDVLRASGIRRFLTTNSLPYVPASPWARVEVVELADLLAPAIHGCLSERDTGSTGAGRRAA